MGSMSQRQNWTFLTNHARVLVAIARDPAVRLRDVAAVCGLTERTVQTIVTDLETDGYLRRVRDGRRNRYEISPGAVFRHPAEAGVQVAGLLALLTGAPADPDAPAPSPDTDPDTDGPEEAGEPEGGLIGGAPLPELASDTAQ
ncbi:MarR family transcriptional regulator [Streptomyces sp. CB00455]|uniref:MarR family transcriptional regulator n=1 Tax=Streptomyces sp. CB00455 TaxID=1703927 RepID=UPI0009A0E0ED|nr:helix-turn-helix domain-containing protein [Streptomyces sp. CB00455]